MTMKTILNRVYWTRHVQHEDGEVVIQSILTKIHGVLLALLDADGTRGAVMGAVSERWSGMPRLSRVDSHPVRL